MISRRNSRVFCELCSQKHLAERYQWTAARIFLLAQIRTYVRFSVVHTILNQFTCQAPTRHIIILFFMLSQTNCKVIFTGGIIPEYGCEILVYPETDKTPVNLKWIVYDFYIVVFLSVILLYSKTSGITRIISCNPDVIYYPITVHSMTSNTSPSYPWLSTFLTWSTSSLVAWAAGT